MFEKTMDLGNQQLSFIYNEASPTTISKESRIQANSKRAASLITEKDEDIVWSHAKV
jgi:hypothetical protein